MGEAPLPQRARSYWKTRFSAFHEKLEPLLESERAQLPPWAIVGLIAGIASWLGLPRVVQWQAFLALATAGSIAGFLLIPGRSGRSLGWFALMAMLGCGLIWARSSYVAAPKLEKPLVSLFEGRVERVEMLSARETVRLTLAPTGVGLPTRVRVSVASKDFPEGLTVGSRIRVRARLAPPPPMALPGTYDFSRDAWFRGIGAVGKALGKPEVVASGRGGGLDGARETLRRHIARRVDQQASGIAIALVTGDQNGVGEDDADAMRRSGLTHLLSVSGLHIAAVVGFVMFLTMRLLALFPAIALRFNLILIAAAVAALAGIAYTALTGMQVPTVRSCIAALLILAGIALGRDALSLRLIAVGALAVLLFRPEALAGASFQMSFAAVTAIVTLHSTSWSRRWFGRGEEGFALRTLRALGALVATGFVVELALVPLALFHFHRAGLYGVGANIVAIPLTTFVIMPAEALALMCDAAGLGAPFWWLTEQSILLLLRIAHAVAETKGAVAAVPSMPVWAFTLMVAGGLWLCLWRGRVRLAGWAPILIGLAGAAMQPTPDVLVTGDGRHAALLGPGGAPALLRERAGDYIRDTLSEASGFDGEPGVLDLQSFGRCSRDACIADLVKDGRSWRLLATRSKYLLQWRPFIAACSDSDIVISDRRLPEQCRPRWLKLDRVALAKTGGTAIVLADHPRVATVAGRIGEHPWRAPVPAQ